MPHLFRSLRKRNFRLLVLHIGCKSVQQPQAHAAVSQFFSRLLVLVRQVAMSRKEIT
jgi:hypothetical protein